MQNTFTGGGWGWGWDGLSEDKANLSPPVGFELGLGAELGKNIMNTLNSNIESLVNLIEEEDEEGNFLYSNH